MKGDPKVIECLNEALFLELAAVNQYWLHYRLLDDWGYARLAKKEREESLEEMAHADKLIERIIFLEGHPNLQTLAPLRIGQRLVIPTGQATNATKGLKIYSVRRGDTPFMIAKRFKMPLESLLQINRLTPRCTIYPGQTLKVQ